MLSKGHSFSMDTGVHRVISETEGKPDRGTTPSIHTVRQMASSMVLQTDASNIGLGVS